MSVDSPFCGVESHGEGCVRDSAQHAFNDLEDSFQMFGRALSAEMDRAAKALRRMSRKH